MSSGRLYVGRVSSEARKSDVEDFFGQIGKIRDVRLLSGFAFVEYDDARDAEDAVRDLSGKEFFGDRLIIEFAKAPRGDRGDRGDRGGYSDRGPPPFRGRGGPPSKGYRITIENLAPGTNWQDLKDFARSAGNVIYAEVSRGDSSTGVIEYPNQDDVDNAFKQLDGSDLNGNRIKLVDNLGGFNYTSGAGTGGGGGGGTRYTDRDDRRRDDDRGSSRRDEGRDRDRDRSPKGDRSPRERRRSPEYSDRRRDRSRSRSPRRDRGDRY